MILLLTLDPGVVMFITLVASVSGLFIIIVVVAALCVYRCKKKHLGETCCYELHFLIIIFQYFFYISLKKNHHLLISFSNLPPGSDANDLTVYADISEIATQDVSILHKLWRFDFLCLLEDFFCFTHCSFPFSDSDFVIKGTMFCV